MDSLPRPKDDEIDAGHVPAMVDTGAVILDVREPYEWDAGHAPQAVHVPMGLLSLDGLPDGRPLLVVCHLGVRSAAVVEALASGRRRGGQCTRRHGRLVGCGPAGRDGHRGARRGHLVP